MKIIVNGEPLEAKAATLADLLGELGYEGGWYATAVNGEVVAKGERDATALAESDRVEILTPRQGG